MRKELVKRLLEHNESNSGFYYFGLIKLNIGALNNIKRKEVNKRKDNIYNFLVVETNNGMHLIIFGLKKGEDVTKIQPNRKHRIIKRRKEYYSQQHERKYLYNISRRLKSNPNLDLKIMDFINNEIKKYLVVVDAYPTVIENIALNEEQRLPLYRNFLQVVAKNRVLFDRRLRESLKKQTKAKAIIINFAGQIEEL